MHNSGRLGQPPGYPPRVKSWALTQGKKRFVRRSTQMNADKRIRREKSKKSRTIYLICVYLRKSADDFLLNEFSDTALLRGHSGKSICPQIYADECGWENPEGEIQEILTL